MSYLLSLVSKKRASLQKNTLCRSAAHSQMSETIPLFVIPITRKIGNSTQLLPKHQLLHGIICTKQKEWWGQMSKFSFTGSFSYRSAGKKFLLFVPKGVSGTFAISNNSRRSFVLILDGIKEFSVKPYSIARIGIASPGFPTRISIQTRGAARGSFIYQQNQQK
ncbi:hypothetical protein EDM54_09785 [Brevibacillus borstelensis]|uniref:hypothetical protein n=1 Tax=Brevibacillus borstelensis TaxID=45462 RepID=UPI000F07F576|nr:hypothetical protein [Brevibacillus borstelensis]MED1743176.1 hypothetical protein [Brevibacillus borstelensis]MED1884640.1 hypothetical protein [Brevibacillus borstelensis]RNB63593.1 hypothetical protein EDM54_09785 [Brevibacillus borstelensis]